MPHSFYFPATPSVPPSYLLDDFPGATYGISTRKIRSDYTGPCMRIQRSSDDAELDIGFIGNSLDTAAILSFIGGASARVVIWYDQGLEGVNGVPAASQLANYPFIAISGVIQTLNGVPAVRCQEISAGGPTGILFAGLPASYSASDGTSLFLGFLLPLINTQSMFLATGLTNSWFAGAWGDQTWPTVSGGTLIGNPSYAVDDGDPINHGTYTRTTWRDAVRTETPKVILIGNVKASENPITEYYLFNFNNSSYRAEDVYLAEAVQYPGLQFPNNAAIRDAINQYIGAY